MEPAIIKPGWHSSYMSIPFFSSATKFRIGSMYRRNDHHGTTLLRSARRKSPLNYHVVGAIAVSFSLISLYTARKLTVTKAHRSWYESGETGIRTLDPLARITVFETAPIGHSGISPALKIVRGRS